VAIPLRENVLIFLLNSGYELGLMNSGRELPDFGRKMRPNSSPFEDSGKRLQVIEIPNS
jgi:hypothetical protein